MTEVSKEALEEAIHNLHGCDSAWVKAVPAMKTFEAQTVWDGTVQVFELHGYPTESRCYAWTHEIDEEKQRFLAVLHEVPVDSPKMAMRATVTAEYRILPLTRGTMVYNVFSVLPRRSPIPLEFGLLAGFPFGQEL